MHNAKDWWYVDPQYPSSTLTQVSRLSTTKSKVSLADLSPKAQFTRIQDLLTESPLPGHQLGEPLVDDMTAWTEEDYQSICETMEKVKQFGWEQDDFRCANFVRLTGPDNIERIAMIDCESVVKTTEMSGDADVA